MKSLISLLQVIFLLTDGMNSTGSADLVFKPYEGDPADNKILSGGVVKRRQNFFNNSNLMGPLIEKNGSTFILENNITQISYTCFSPTKQVEIVTDGDFSTLLNRVIGRLVNFNKDLTIVEGYRIFIKLHFINKFNSPYVLYCKHVGSMESIRRVLIQPSNTTNEVLVTQDNQYEPEHFTRKCEYTLTIVKAPAEYSNYYEKCQKTSDGTILQTKFNKFECLHIPSCAFCFERQQRKTCAKFGHFKDYQENKSLWQETSFRTHAAKSFRGGGVEVCGDDEAAAMYYYTGFNDKDQKIHFSFEYNKDIFAEDIISISVNETNPCVGDTITVNFLVLAFFLGSDPIIKITSNEKVILQVETISKVPVGRVGINTYDYDIKLDLVGNYTVECSFIPNYMQHWIYLSKSFYVKESIKPFFETNFETIRFYLEETNKEINCIAKGYPPPKITWDINSTSFAKINGTQLFLPTVTELIAGIYICTATNKYGESAKKQFKIEVYKKNYDWILPVSLCVVVVVIIIIAGVFLKYRLKSELLQLTKVEIDTFFNGTQTISTDVDEDIILPESIPYDTKYDLERNYIKLDESIILGAGEFGFVRKGIVEKNGKKIPVGIKSIKPQKLEYLNVLMSELKVMAYIGEHKNIVSLIGAFTSNLKNRELLICMELCEVSLHSYLNKHSQMFLDLFIDLSQEEKSSKNEVKLTTLDLLIWSCHIACGMDFLEKKKIIHGDLATRNILLDKDFVAKISDFGLAKQLIGYTYIKTSACPLPWKWMAIEALSEMKFSTESDVWAFGVTLWEIFSLGQTPYAGLSWSINFVNELVSGLRLNCPKYSNSQLYTNIMLKCWIQNPKERISFTEVKNILTNLIENCKRIHTSVGIGIHNSNFQQDEVIAYINPNLPT